MSEGLTSPAPKNNNTLIIGGAVALLLMGCCTFAILLYILSSRNGAGSGAQTTRPTRTPRAVSQPTSIPVNPSTGGGSTSGGAGGSADVGSSRDSAAPVGTTVVSDQMAFTVGEVVRPADRMILDGNEFNTTAEPGNEMVMVTLSINCQATEKCNFGLSFLKLLGSSGIAHDPRYVVVGVAGMLDSTEFYNGANISGNVAFEVQQSETDLMLIYSPLLSNDIYLRIQ